MLAIGATLVDYRSLRAYAPAVYLLSCVGLVAVLTPLGATINGAHSWIVLPAGFQIQPSEFAKVALVVGMAMLLGETRDGEDRPRDGDVLLVLALAAVPMALVMLQPDLGTTLVLVSVVLGVLGWRRAPRRWIAGLLVAGVVVGVRRRARWASSSDYQVDRFAAFAEPRARPARGRLQHQPGADRDRLGRPDRQGAVRGHADQRPLHPRAADRLRLHRRRGGARPARRGGGDRCCSASCCGAGCGIARRRRRRLRPARRGRRRVAGSPSRASSTSG